MVAVEVVDSYQTSDTMKGTAQFEAEQEYYLLIKEYKWRRFNSLLVEVYRILNDIDHNAYIYIKFTIQGL